MGMPRSTARVVAGAAGLACVATLSVGTGVVTAGATSAPSGNASAYAPGATVLASSAQGGNPGNGPADRPQISRNGRFVTFDSLATNLVAGVTTAESRVYRKDLTTGEVVLVSRSDADQPANGYSSFSWPDDTGNLVAFASDVIDLTPIRTTSRSVYLRDISAGTTELVSVGLDGGAADAPSTRSMLSGDGRYVAFSSYASNLTTSGGNGEEQVYVRDRVAGTTRLVSVAADGGLGDERSYRGMVSADGRYVAFASFAANLVVDGSPRAENIYLRDLVAGTTTRIANLPSGKGSPNGGSRPYLTPDGRSLIFNSLDGLVAEDTNGELSDVYLYDVPTGTLERQSVSAAGGNGDGDSLRGFVSDDSRYVVFNSFSGNLVARDTNASGDVFLRDRETGRTKLLSRTPSGGGGDAQSFRPVISGDASEVTYLSEARNLVAGDTSQGFQVYAVGTGIGDDPEPADTTRPRVKLRSPKNGSTVRRKAVTVRGVARDDRAVKVVRVKVRDRATKKWLRANGHWGRKQSSLRASLTRPGARSTAWKRKVRLPHGRYQVVVIARDAAGNRSAPARRKFAVARRGR